MVQDISINKREKLGILSLLLCVLFSISSLAESAFNSVPMPIGLGIVEEVQFPNVDSDIMGLRLSLIYGRNANVSWLDFGVLGCRADGSLFGLQLSAIFNSIGSAYGALQISGIVNNCQEDYYGIQLASIANRTEGNVSGVQLALFNMSNDLSGTQIGVFNQAENAFGIQIGVINMANDMKGIQLGVFNVIKSSSLPCMLIINASF